LIDGRAIGNLPNFIHKIHAGHSLAKQGYDYADVKFNHVGYPQDIRNCTKCHDGGTDKTKNQTAQGDNWKTAPSALACGSCHDGINFKTGTGVKLADANKGLTTSAFAHPAGAQPDDSLCAICHKADTVDLNHLPVTPPSASSFHHVAAGTGNANSNSAWIASNTARLPAGAIKVTYDIKTVAVVDVAGKKRPQMVFRLLQNGARADLQNPDTAPVNPATGKQEIWANFMGAPSIYFVWAVPQDGIAAPAEFNASASGYLRCLWNKTDPTPDPTECVSGGDLTGPDADGYYTATLTAAEIPSTATMVTGGVGYSYNLRSTMPLTQTNLADYPTSPSLVTGVGATDATATTTQLMPNMPNRIGGLIVIAPNAQKVATGFTGRRAIVEDKRCTACHQELGAFTEEAFHGGQRNDGSTCAWCHTPNRASSGWSADSTAFVHAIHAKAKRTVKYNWHAVSPTDGYWEIGYPGVLKDCEACHVPGTSDFSATASAAALPNRLYRTTVSGTLASTSTSAFAFAAPQDPLRTANNPQTKYFDLDVNYGTGFSFNAGTGVTTPAAGTTLVTSPISTACFSCHDSKLSRAHMEVNGGTLYGTRSVGLATTETCMVCHEVGRVGDIKAVHKR
jgi:OmcA/MtrC family decaheme c-type cytochrome